ncbi:unnamed protein product [Clonostachys byssicola]|uniref:Uncharacterized protein n=1 Tax=Clonostachys byssicola TaxID=160290 RepID=A0A9N9ULI1_9HYPO|nr:unnamed protein product [Clonostachys byssicola]
MLWKRPPLAPMARLVQHLSNGPRPGKRHLASILLATFLILQLRKLLRLLRRRRTETTMAAAKKAPAIPGFTALSEQIFVHQPDLSDGKTVPADDPDVVMVYGWGDCLPKHVAKYADGFRELFPHSKQIVVLSPISRAMFSDLKDRSQWMTPIIDEIFPSGPHAPDAPKKILAHTMSNTGAIFYTSMINAYQDRYHEPFPHQLLSMDSTPGSTDFHWANLQRWSRAMALGTAAWFPWPFVVTQTIWAMALSINGLYESLIGREHAGAWGRKAANNEKYEAKGARKLYLYSKEDDLIGYEDIEIHAAEAAKLGWQMDLEMFEGSGHVGHMRAHAVQYWKAIQDSWKRAIAAPAPEASS